MSKSQTYHSRKPELSNTKSGLSNDQKVPDRATGHEIGDLHNIDNRVTQIKQSEENYIDLPNTLYHIDKQVINYIRDTISPTLYINGDVVKVPVVYAESEKFQQIQRYGYMRDRNGKIQCPVIAIKDTSIELDGDYPRLRATNAHGGNQIVYRQQYSRQNPYDKFSTLKNQAPNAVFQSFTFPEVVIAKYDLILWTDYRSEIKELIEHFMHYNGKAFGQRGEGQPYVTTIEGFNKDMTDDIGEDKIVGFTLNLSTRGYVIPRHNVEEQQHRNLSVGKVVLTERVD